MTTLSSSTLPGSSTTAPRPPCWFDRRNQPRRPSISVAELICLRSGPSPPPRRSPPLARLDASARVPRLLLESPKLPDAPIELGHGRVVPALLVWPDLRGRRPWRERGAPLSTPTAPTSSW